MSENLLWRPDWFACSPLYQDLQEFALHQPFITSVNWPSLELLMQSLELKEYRLVAQDELDRSGFGYEAFVARYQEIPTRQNWHDWFNALIWHLFPLSKRKLNQLHLHDIQHAGSARTTRRDALTLFDECAIILAVSESEIQSELHQHAWHRLFIERASEWGQTIRPFVFGHALYEQALLPHIGWCGKVICQPVASEFFALPRSSQYAFLDRHMAHRLEYLSHPKQLSPLPLLGVPGWHEEQTESFYQNHHYFCPARKPTPYRLWPERHSLNTQGEDFF